MDIGRHLRFCPPDSPYFDVPARLNPDEGNFPLARADLPDGWTRHSDTEWVGINAPGAELPPQGWKIHVSATLENAQEVLDTVADYCLALGVTFKFIRGLAVLEQRNSKYGDRSASGKFVTVYPADEAQLERILRELGERLDGQEGPYILSDLRWRSGPLYVRYGGFVLRTVRDARGAPVHCIEDPDGNLVPDHRGPGFRPPQWVTLPDCLTEALAARNAGTLQDFPYRVTGALHFSNGGGVYRGVDSHTGDQVLLREARPHAGLVEGRDAVYRQEREYWALQRLAGLDCVPRLLDFRKGREHWFLVREYVEGEPLGRLMIQRNPLTRGSTEPGDFAAYATWALGVLDQVERGVTALHERGVVFGDLHPSNILVRPDGTVGFIDFETAAEPDAVVRQTMGAAGFTAPDGITGTGVDRHALGCLRLAVFMSLTTVLPWGPQKAEDLITAVTERFPLPAGFAARVRADLGLPEGTAGTDWRPEATTWPALSGEIAAGVLAAATPERQDRLFPGDPEQFLTPEGGAAFAYGAAGVLWSLAECGADVPGEFTDRLLADARATADPRPGFYDGTSGIAFALDRLGRRAAAAELLDSAVPPADGTDDTLLTGLSGIGLTLLHLARRTGDRELLGRAGDLADRITGRPEPEPDADRRFGLLRGPAGSALFLLRLYEETKDPALLEHARAALREDLRRLGFAEDGSLPGDAPGRMPLLGMGCAGTGMVLHDLLTHHHDPGLGRARDVIRELAGRHHLPQAGVFHGRAGTVLALRHLTGDDGGAGEGERDGADDGSGLRRHLRDFGLQAVSGEDGRPAFLGHESLRISTDFATGGAGVLLALHAALAGGPALPFFAAPDRATARAGEEAGA